MDDRGTRIIGLVLLGLLGFGALVAITVCAVARVEVPAVLIALGSSCAGAIAAFVPPSRSGQLDQFSAYAHDRNHKLFNVLNDQSLKMERLLITLESRLPPAVPPKME